MRCIIVDDEPIARRGLKRLVEGYGELELLGVFGSARDAATFLETADVDLIFLDIRMEGMDGLELARAIAGRAMVIFTTAYAQYAVDGFEVNAIDYLMKPIKRGRLAQAVGKALEYHRMMQREAQESGEVLAARNHVIVKSERRYVRLSFNDIIYIEGLKDYVIIHVAGSRVVTKLTLKGILEALPGERFLRISKSYAVNRDRVTAWDNNEVEVDGVTLPIGPAYRDVVLAVLHSKSIII